MRLQGKAAIITGAGQTVSGGHGNGRATALLFAREGARLLLANRSATSLEETRDLIRAEGFEADCIIADITRDEDCERLVEAAVAKFGRVDILHNNVGIGQLDGDTTRIETEAWNWILNVNVTGAMQVSRQVLSVMRDQKSGSITHVSSIAAIASLPLIAYKTAKMALNEFTRWLAFENAPYNIRCNVLQLGLIDTPTALEVYRSVSGAPIDEIRRERAERVPMGRMGTAAEVARAALFLASEDASFVTGAVLPVDGGMHTRVG